MPLDELEELAKELLEEEHVGIELLLLHCCIISYCIFDSKKKMFRSIPVANKLCFDKELKRSWEIHENKLKHLKCSIDRSKPSEFGFLQSRPKKEVLREFRDAEVLRENRVLLNKISEISVEGKPAVT